MKSKLLCGKVVIIRTRFAFTFRPRSATAFRLLMLRSGKRPIARSARHVASNRKAKKFEGPKPLACFAGLSHAAPCYAKLNSAALDYARLR
jgi:hypothetical protein